MELRPITSNKSDEQGEEHHTEKKTTSASTPRIKSLEVPG